MLQVLARIALAAAAVSLVIFVHELGHFLAAKAVGLRVEVFSIGFWRRLVGFRIGQTDYRLSLIPLGGYVRVAGEADGVGEGHPQSISSKTPGQRAAYVAAGALMNLVLAAGLFIAAFGLGVPSAVAEVGAVAPGSPAWRAGLKPGDRITRVDDIEDPVFLDVARAAALSGGREVTLTLRRDGKVRTVGVRPQFDKRMGVRLIGISPPVEPIVTEFEPVGDTGRSPGRDAGLEPGDRILAVGSTEVHTLRDVLDALAAETGREVALRVRRGDAFFDVSAEPLAVPPSPLAAVAPGPPPRRLGVVFGRQKTILKRYGVYGATRMGLISTGRALAEVVRTLKGIITREISPRQMGGVILIAQSSYYAAGRGLGMLAYLTAVISAAIGVANLLPVPVLDGGHLMFIFIEKLRGRRLCKRLMAMAQTAGMTFIILLAAYVTCNDVIRILRYS